MASSSTEYVDSVYQDLNPCLNLIFAACVVSPDLFTRRISSLPVGLHTVRSFQGGVLVLAVSDTRRDSMPGLPRGGEIHAKERGILVGVEVPL